MLDVLSQPLMPGSSEPKLHAHLLIVDDDPLQRLLLRRLLNTEYAVTEAQSGREAIRLLSEHAFDLMLLDVMLPGLSGLDVLQRARASLSSTDLPVIIVSALDSHSDIIHGLNLGANDYVAKPFHPDVIRARVRTQIELKRLADANKAAIAQLRSNQQVHAHRGA
jgi:DNA-binding response OmpR family regulator